MGLKKQFFIIITAGLCLAACKAAPDEAYVPSGARISESFNDGWMFKKGPFAADSLLFSASGDWEQVTLPHTWNNVDMQAAKDDYYAGTGVYSKTFTPPLSLKGKRVFLRFEGVGSVADVYVDGKFAGNHMGAYSAFAVELTRLLRYGEENRITVKANNEPRPDVIPINNTLFPVYGGIYRPVRLIATSMVNIAVTDYASPGVYITQKNACGKSAWFEVVTKVENRGSAAEEITLETSVYDDCGMLTARQRMPVTVSPQGRNSLMQEFVMLKPHLWQGREDPYLYKVSVRLLSGGGEVIDEVVQPLGLRRFELRAGDGMYLNGEKVPMYGVCRHQDWWGYGSALSNKQHDADLELIREIGATTIRFAHYQQAEYVYAKCDSIGFIVWAEIPFVNRVSTREAANARRQLTELIRQNYNHPSIYVWGLHNEVYSPENYTSALTADLHDLAKTEDPSRYTVSVSGYSRVDRPTNLHADIQGINHYFGWYGGEIGDVRKWVEEMERDFPGYMVIFSEYGAEANIFQQEETVGESGRYFSQFYPETFATKFHERQWGVISEHPYLLASYVWNMFDFATPATAQGGIPARNMKGLVTFDRQVKKDPFYWYKANWSGEPVVYLTQRRAVERENRVTPVTVYSNIGVPHLFVNGEELSGFETGNTSVHYIFPEVRLREGENVIEAKAVHEGEVYADRIVWNYSPGNKAEETVLQPAVNTEEHVGL